MLVRFATAALVIAVMVGSVPPAVAEDLPIVAFAGHFSGTDTATDEVSESVDETERNIDVIITPVMALP
mgnify:CR=1 FL=1